MKLIENTGKGLMAIAAKLDDLGILAEHFAKPYEEIKLLLTDYQSQARNEIDPKLIRKIKSYLKKLNADSHVPLDFRLKVMALLTEHVEILDDRLLPDALNSYRAAIEVLYGYALNDRELAPSLAELAATAMTLSTRIQRKNARQYKRPSLINVRETLSLAKLALELTRKFHLEGTDGASTLRQQIALHEIIRSMRTRAMTVKDQQIVFDALYEQMQEDHLIDVRFIPGNSHMEIFGFALISDIQKANLLPRKSLRINETTTEDTIVCELDLLITKMIEEMKSSQSIMGKSTSRYHDDFAFINERLNKAIISGLAMIDLMREKKRSYERKPPNPPVYIQIEDDVGQALDSLISNKKSSSFILQNATTGETSIWLTVDASEGGYCLEKLPSDVNAYSSFEVADLVYITALTRADNKAGTKELKQLDQSLCTVCWYEQDDDNVARIGLSRLKNGEARRARIKTSLLTTEAPKEFASFVEKISEDSLGIWTVDVDLSPGTCIEIHTADGIQIGKVGKPIKYGANYTVYGCKLQ